MAEISSYAEHRVPRPDGELYARDYPGSEPAFVVLHGFPDNLHIYDDLIPHLVAGGRRVIAFDFMGYGASDKPAGAVYSFKQQLGDLEAVVEHRRLKRIVPVAHDSAGPAAVNFAIDHPEQTASLVILNSVYGDTPGLRLPEFIELFATKSLRSLSTAILHEPAQFGWLLNFQRAEFQRGLNDEQKGRYASFLGPVIDENFRAKPSSGPAFGQMTAGLFEETARNAGRIAMLQTLKTPAKVIWGESDPYLDIEMAKYFSEHLKLSTLHLLPGGHWIQIDQPERVAAIMLADV